MRAADTSIYLDHVVFTNTLTQLITIDDSSCNIQHCIFPSIRDNELVHFNNMPSNGHALFDGNLFGTPGIPATSGYNDIIDFTGGNRPGPIVQFLNNVFPSAVDDCLDLDGTDAHIEGNIFMHVHQDAARASSSNPIATGSNAGALTEVMVCRNIFYDCDHMLLIKDNARVVAQNNTILKITDNPTDSNLSAVINWHEPGRSNPGFICIFEGNLVRDVAFDRFVLHYTNDVMPFLVEDCILPISWPGAGNLTPARSVVCQHQQSHL